MSSSSANGDTPFRDLLQSRARASGRDVRASIEDEVAARIRDGRTDAAAASDDKRDTVRERSEGPAAEERRDAERSADTDEGRREDGERGRDRRRGDDGGDRRTRGDATENVEDAGDASDAPPTAPAAPATDARAIERSGGGHPAALEAPPTMPAAPSGAAGVGVSVASGAARGVAPVAGAAASSGGAGRTSALPAQSSATAAADRGAASRAQAKAPAAPDRSAVERAEAVLEQLKARIRAGAREATIHLRPEDLGRIEMRVRVSADGVRASMLAESPETLRVLEQHLPELKAWLARDAEGPVTVDLDLLDERGGSAREGLGRDAGEHRGGGSGGRAGTRGAAPLPESSAPPSAGATTPAAGGASPSSSGVDLVA